MQSAKGHNTHIVRIVDTSDVQHSPAEVTVRHLQGIIRHPKGDTETIRNTGETTARRRVGFEHQERFVVLLREHRAVQVWSNCADGAAVSQIFREDILGVARRTKASIREGSSTVVIGITASYCISKAVPLTIANGKVLTAQPPMQSTILRKSAKYLCSTHFPDSKYRKHSER